MMIQDAKQNEMSAQPPPYPNEKDGYGVGCGKPLMVATPSRPSPLADIRVPPDPLNRINLQTRFADVTGERSHCRSWEIDVIPSGTYYIAPHIVAPEVSGRRKKQKRKQKHIPDAVFRSRRGNLSLDLGTTGYASENAKASIDASTKSGNISLNLIAGSHVRPRFEVEVNTRTGSVVLFVPSTFSGAIQLHTKTGDLQFLPGITAEMRVVKSTETEYLVLLGPQPLPSGGQQAPADFCRLRTRSGNIVVGIRGKDEYVKAAGLWERITGFMRG
ncbi:hypothetical protein C8F01DRAFT_1123689 [Mycena amicta]|nr:hypothetical protein C8F01DRAFT_1123689 [Mycena amicta]